MWGVGGGGGGGGEEGKVEREKLGGEREVEAGENKWRKRGGWDERQGG